MEIKIEVEKEEQELKTGDVVLVGVSKNPYFVISTNDGYIAKGFDGASGSTGHHNTLKELQRSLERHGLIILSKEEYELVLRKK